MNRLTKHSGTFQYDDQKIPYTYWSNITAKKPPDTILFLGAGAVGIIPCLVAKQAGPGVVIVSGIPHWHADSSGKDITEFSKKYFLSAYSLVLNTFSLHSAHIVAESQAAPAAVLLAIAYPKKVQNITLVRPLGFTVKAFGSDRASRMRTFKKRILKTYLQFRQSFLYDPKNLLITLAGFRAMLLEPSYASLFNKYAEGVSYDLLHESKQAAAIQSNKNHTFSMILGEKDKMFPPNEILIALKSYNIKNIQIEIVPADSHSSLAVRSSKRTLRTALNKVRRGTS